MKRYLLGTICVVALGCNTDTTTTQDIDTTREPAARVTTNRPNLDGTTTTQRPTADTTRLSDDTQHSRDRDNTGVNERDRGAAAKTPLDQHNNDTDIEITANIRQRVVDTEMSTNAQNVKIITEEGRVTLRGPVATAAERTQIDRIAQEVAGAGNVDNQLEVQP